MKIRLALLSAVFLVAGCAQDPRIVAFEAGKRKVDVDKRVLMECEDLARLTGATEEERLKADEQWTKVYKECRMWKKTLNDIVKDAFNTEPLKKETK